MQTDSPYPGLPYNAWSNAAHAIQTAIDASAPGDTVVVADGVYDSGGTVVYGNMTNRVAVTKAITLRSANGPVSTIIRGQGPLGSTAIRCVYLTNGATLVGFTLTNGYTTLSGSVWEEESGGVYWSYITNCVIESNSATYGGGTYNGVVVRCILRGNVASNSGGGLYDGTIRGYLVAGNSAREGGGGTYFLNGGSLENCTVAGNSSDYPLFLSALVTQ